MIPYAPLYYMQKETVWIYIGGGGVFVVVVGLCYFPTAIFYNTLPPHQSCPVFCIQLQARMDGVHIAGPKESTAWFTTSNLCREI